MAFSKVLLIDASRCRGCGRCEMACSFAREGHFLPASSCIRITRLKDNVSTIPVVCQQCKEPWCIFACPTGALKKNHDTGIISLTPEQCVGCLQCFFACPFGGISLSPQRLPIKCDLCEGEPRCANACDYQAIEFVELEHANALKREWGLSKLVLTK